MQLKSSIVHIWWAGWIRCRTRTARKNVSIFMMIRRPGLVRFRKSLKQKYSGIVSSIRKKRPSQLKGRHNLIRNLNSPLSIFKTITLLDTLCRERERKKSKKEQHQRVFIHNSLTYQCHEIKTWHLCHTFVVQFFEVDYYTQYVVPANTYKRYYSSSIKKLLMLHVLVIAHKYYSLNRSSRNLCF